MFCPLIQPSGARPQHPPSGQHQIGQSEQRVELRLVLGQPPVTHLAMPEALLDHLERMLDLGPHARLGLLQALARPAQRILGQGPAMV